MDEIISGVQVIKMYAWEKPFAQLITAARQSELSVILKNGYIRAFHMTFNLFTFRMAIFCSVLSVILFNGSETITVSKMFMLSYIYSMVAFMSQAFVRCIAEVAETLIALKRLQKFLQYEEIGDLVHENKNAETINLEQIASKEIAISIKNVSAEWRDNFNETKSKVKSYTNQSISSAQKN